MPGNVKAKDSWLAKLSKIIHATSIARQRIYLLWNFGSKEEFWSKVPGAGRESFLKKWLRLWARVPSAGIEIEKKIEEINLN